MASIKISIINACSDLKDADVERVVPDLQTQVHRDFAGAWGIDADLGFVPRRRKAPAGSWQLVLLDSSDQAGALGYHDLTREGKPLGKVFVKTTLAAHDSWTATLSHELLEMLGDPDINLTAFVQSGQHAGRLFAYEVCDACEDDQFAYKIGRTLVSDFVYPSWFETFHGARTRYDQCGHVTAPFQLLKGGYISVYDIRGGGGWTQLNARQMPDLGKSRPKVGSRRERRRTPREQWMRSKR